MHFVLKMCFWCLSLSFYWLSEFCINFSLCCTLSLYSMENDNETHFCILLSRSKVDIFCGCAIHEYVWWYCSWLMPYMFWLSHVLIESCFWLIHVDKYWSVYGEVAYCRYGTRLWSSWNFEPTTFQLLSLRRRQYLWWIWAQRIIFVSPLSLIFGTVSKETLSNEGTDMWLYMKHSNVSSTPVKTLIVLENIGWSMIWNMVTCINVTYLTCLYDCQCTCFWCEHWFDFRLLWQYRGDNYTFNSVILILSEFRYKVHIRGSLYW